MREQLKKIEGARKTFYAVFERNGTKSGWQGKQLPTILLKNVKTLSGKEVTDHIWFNLTKGFEMLQLKEGDEIKFDARVKEYIKGYMGDREEVIWERPVQKDYKLSNPTKVMLIKRAKQEIDLDEFIGETK